MGGRRVQHLVERGRGFQVRLPVPVDLQGLLKRKELRWSVQTREPKLAARRALNATLAFHRLCDNLRLMKDLTVEDARQIAQDFYQSLTASYRSPPPVAAENIGYEAGYQKAMTDEFIGQLEDQVQARSFKSDVTSRAAEIAERGGYQMPPIGSEAFRALCEGVARAQIEHARFILFRQSNFLGPYDPQDEFLRTAFGRSHAALDSGLQFSAATKSLTLKEAVERHIGEFATGPNAWKPTTKEEKERIFGVMTAVLGPDLPVIQITGEHVRAMRDFIRDMRSRGALDPQNPRKMLAKADEERLNPKTATKYFSYVRTFLKWLDAEQYVDGIPGASIQLKVPKGGAANPVLPFNADHLEAIFSSPLFSGFKSRSQRHLPGPKKAQDGLYWIYLLALYTGMRAGELLQISRSDVKLSDDVPHIDIRPELSLKTDASARKVPIHAALLDYGLSDWLSARVKKADERLFFEIEIGKGGRISSVASKRLNKYLERIGVKTGRELVFHSFRHTFSDAARSSGIPDERISQIVGHSVQGTTAGYGQGANLKSLKMLVDGIDFGLSDEVRALLKANAMK